MKSRLLLWWVIWMLLLPAVLSAQQRWLQGKVVSLGEHDALRPEPNLTVTIEQTGDTDTTNSRGVFRVFIPPGFKAGERVALHVDKPDWRIQYPLDGEARIPANIRQDLVHVQLLPVGSPLFWSPDRIEKFIRDMAQKSQEQLRPAGTPQEIDFSRYIKDWAVTYGFSAQQAKAEIDQWIADVEAKQQEDSHQRGLAAFAKKQFGKASQLFEGSATSKVQKLAALKRQREAEEQQLTEEIVRDFRLAGDAHANNYQFADALHAYQQALQHVSQDHTPQRWAATLLDMGKTHRQLGIRVSGPAVQQHLRAAVEVYRQALTVYTQATLLQDWAATQTNLGIALREQGLRTSGERSTVLLAEAVAAYRQALTVRTQAALPQDWARTQTNLGNVLRDQGRRTSGEQSTALLAEAVAAYRQALTVRTRAALPQDWAQTQTNLGNVLRDQGRRTSGERSTALLAEAVAAYRQALTVWTRAALPQAWAQTQNNLGVILGDQGIRIGGAQGAALLAEAVAAYRQALTVRTRAALPQDWAQTQNNLADAYTVLADWPQAAASYVNVLQVYPDYAPAYRQVARLYHEVLFDFPQAFALHQQWLVRHPEELITLINFAATHFTTGRFAPGAERLAALQQHPDIEPRAAIGLQAIEIATLLALDKVTQVPALLARLLQQVRAQPEDFTVGWSFAGTRHAMRQHASLAPHRHWLQALFDALEGADRQAIVRGLQAAQTTWQAQDAATIDCKSIDCSSGSKPRP